MIFGKVIAVSSLCAAFALAPFGVLAETTSHAKHGKKKPATVAHHPAAAAKNAKPGAVAMSAAAHKNAPATMAKSAKAVKPTTMKSGKTAPKTAGKTGKRKHAAPAHKV